MLSAHTNCTQANLKDTSMQYYSNENIFHIIDNGIKYYESLPPPSADFKTTLEINSDTMRNISQTPCFGEGTILMLQNPLTKGYVHCKIENIKKNDILFGSATVLCVIKSKVGDHKVINIEDGVYITPYHPIVHLPGTQWTFPITRYENCIEVDTNVVYNLVLDKYHKVILGTHASIIACTLGHGIDKDIVAHSYLGTDKVINDLKKLDGWNSGNIIISGIRRDYYGLICEMY